MPKDALSPMRIKEHILNAVAFLGFLEDPSNPSTEMWQGSGFIVGVEEGGVTFFYLVTAAHVALKLEKLGDHGRPLARVNDMHGKGHVVHLRNPGEREIPLPNGEMRKFNTPAWVYHPTDVNADVAVQELYIMKKDKANVNPPNTAIMSTAAFVPQSMFLDPKMIGEDLPIGIGDEVFVTGLFHFVKGKRGNAPIVRTGNLAMVPREKIRSGARFDEIERTFGDMDAYLIESRSIGGLSGSPVYIRGTVDVPNTKRDSMKALDAEYYLLGLVHGHWDIPNGDINEGIPGDPNGNGVNVGIAIVTPAYKVLEILAQGRFKKGREHFLNVIVPLTNTKIKPAKRVRRSAKRIVK